MLQPFRTPRSAAAAVALCAAAAVAGFALGRATRPSQVVPAPAELAASLRAALGEGDSLERLQRTTALLEHLDPGNLVEVAAVYDQMRPVIGEWELRPFVAAWARLDPGEAFDHALRWPARGRREVGAEAALEAWATLDPTEARQTYEKAIEQHASLRAELLRGLVTGWARSGAGLGGLDGFLVLSDKRDEALGAVVRELMRSGGADATQAWAEPILRDGSDRPRFKRSLFRIALRAVARWDPERAAAWAAEHAGSDYAEGGPLVVAGQWARRDGAATMAWLRQLPAGESRDRGVHRAFAQWFRADPAAARAWLDSESLEAFHAPALASYAEKRVEEAPEEAFAWCERIADAERSRRCVQDVASRWYRQDAAAAEVWLEQSPLDEEARNAVRRPRRQRGTGGQRARAGNR